MIPATAVPAVAQDLSIYLPALGDQAQAVAGTDLSLRANPDGATKDVLPWILGIPAGSVAWSFATSTNNPLPRFRAAVRTAVDTFLRQAQSAGALPRGVALLQQAIARWMPQTFDEMLFYAYGLDLTGGPGTGVIDLRPGTVLRVAFADLLQAAAVVSDPLLPGFAGGATTDFPISDNTAGDGSWQVVPDAFIARLVAGGVLSVAPPAPPVAGRTAGVADAADLFFPSFPLPFLRLFIPDQVANPSQTGDTTLSGSFSLGSAASYAELAAATPSAYFRGRAVARVMIRVVVAGESCLVPVGTTLGHILDRLAIRSPSTVRQVTIVRGAGVGQPTATGFPASLLAPTAYPLQADWSGGNFDLADLPLLHGDRIGLP